MKKKIYISIVVVIVAITAVFFYSNKHSTNSASDLALSNMVALANNESGGENVGTGCEKDCMTSQGIQNGSRYYCVKGSGGCYETTCIGGTCVSM